MFGNDRTCVPFALSRHRASPVTTGWSGATTAVDLTPNVRNARQSRRTTGSYGQIVLREMPTRLDH